MRIHIIGAGNVGRARGAGWRPAGHQVVYCVRDPDAAKHKDLTASGFNLIRVSEAATEADVIIIATPWDATRAALETAGDLRGKTVVDCTNPLQQGLTGLTHGKDDSGGEQVARWAPGARVVKAFNTVGANIMADSGLEGRQAVMFICGDDQAKETVRQLSDDLGFETIDAGPLESARLLEPLALLWISSAYKYGLGRGFALSIVRQDA